MSKTTEQTTGTGARASAETVPAETPAPSVLDNMIADQDLGVLSREPDFPCVIGECLDGRHPTLLGRVLVRYRLGDRSLERWVATLQGLPVRVCDRVLMLRPAGSDDFVVTGVVDGFAKRPEVSRSSAACLELKADESIRILDTAGRPLLDVHQGDHGPVLELLHEDLELAAPGRIRIRGREVQFEAEQGTVELKASHDVVMQGETIRLN